MINDWEYQKKQFSDHVATFTDYGNIKILDFRKPGSVHYRIRFLFEEEYYRLHISGDLGELIAYNFTNMNYKDFADDFVDNVPYFTEKIQCHSRPLYEFSEAKARKELTEMIHEYRWIDVEDDDEEYQEEFNDLLDEILVDFDYDTGISREGYEKLSELDSDAWEYAGNIGKEPTGILHLYMFAFELAQEDLKRQESEVQHD